MQARWRRLGLAALGWISTCGAAAPKTEKPPPWEPYIHPQTIVRLPDGRRFNMVCIGDGAPTAIILPGLDGWSLDWRWPQQKLSKITQTCSVDRAGLGFSDPGPMPRDAKATVSDLYQALKSSPMQGPFILVGDSLGGLEVRLFAYEHPQMVSGLLLTDPRIEHTAERMGTPKAVRDKQMAFNRACLAKARMGQIVAGEIAPGETDACVDAFPPQWSAEQKQLLLQINAQSSRFETEISQSDMDGRSSEEVETARRKLGSIPLIILSRNGQDCQTARKKDPLWAPKRNPFFTVFERRGA
jgi:pimeloyl-ACP methyl ester carboxylesterase